MALQRENKTVEERLILVEGFQENTERHYRELKGKLETTSDDVSDIKKAILGTELNGNLGFVTRIKKNEEKIETIKETIANHVVYFKILAFVSSALVIAVIGILTKIIIK
jgi:hypothetical protein